MLVIIRSFYRQTFSFLAGKRIRPIILSRRCPLLVSVYLILDEFDMTVSLLCYFIRAKNGTHTSWPLATVTWREKFSCIVYSFMDYYYQQTITCCLTHHNIKTLHSSITLLSFSLGWGRVVVGAGGEGVVVPS